jgi:hypothetical protein
LVALNSRRLARLIVVFTRCLLGLGLFQTLIIIISLLLLAEGVITGDRSNKAGRVLLIQLTYLFIGGLEGATAALIAKQVITLILVILSPAVPLAGLTELSRLVLLHIRLNNPLVIQVLIDSA